MTSVMMTMKSALRGKEAARIEDEKRSVYKSWTNGEKAASPATGRGQAVGMAAAVVRVRDGGVERVGAVERSPVPVEGGQRTVAPIPTLSDMNKRFADGFEMLAASLAEKQKDHEARLTEKNLQVLKLRSLCSKHDVKVKRLEAELHQAHAKVQEAQDALVQQAGVTSLLKAVSDGNLAGKNLEDALRSIKPQNLDEVTRAVWSEWLLSLAGKDIEAGQLQAYISVLQQAKSDDQVEITRLTAEVANRDAVLASVRKELKAKEAGERVAWGMVRRDGTQVTEQRRELRALERKKAAMNLQIDELQRDKAKLEQELQVIDLQLSIFQEEATARCQQQSQLNSQLTRLQSEISNLEAERKLRQDQIEELSGDKAQLEQQVEDLEGEITRMHAHIIDLQAHNAELQGGVTELQDWVTGLEAQLEKCEAEREALREELRTSQEDAQALAHKLSELQKQYLDWDAYRQDQIQEREVTIADLKAQQLALEATKDAEIAKAQAETESAREQVVSLTDQLAAGQSENSRLTSENDNLAGQVAQLQASLAEAEAQAAAQASQLTSQAEEMQAVRGELTQTQSDNTVLMEELSAQKTKAKYLSSRLLELEEQLVVRNQEYDHLRMDTEQEIGLLRLELEKAGKDVSTARDQAAARTREVARLNSVNEALVQQVAALEADLDEATAQITQLDTSLAEATAQISQLDTSLAEATAQITQLDTSLAEATAQITQLDTSLAEATAQITQLDTSLAEATAQISQLDTSLAEATAQITQLDTSLAEATAQITQLDTSLAEATAQITQLDTSLAEATAQITQLDTSLAEATARAATLTTQLSTSTEAFRAMETQLADMRSGKEALEKEVAGKANEITTLRNRIQELDVKVAEMERKHKAALAENNVTVLRLEAQCAEKDKKVDKLSTATANLEEQLRAAQEKYRKATTIEGTDNPANKNALLRKENDGLLLKVHGLEAQLQKAQHKASKQEAAKAKVNKQ